ncbi:MAG: glycine--tRNA ligase subunit beta [Gammaproteobacteria bacterium]|nr:glycine--tRNA ligase subunit beta [Gammaproteobacteria bacterium]
MTTHQDCLFELGTEELPPQALLTLRDALKKEVCQRLDDTQLGYQEVCAYATPRRLALLIKQLADSQPDQDIERRGPPVSAAYNSQGIPTKSAIGFAKTNGTTVDKLQTLKTDKGEWLCFRTQNKGLATSDLLPDILQQSLNNLPIPKRMRWGDTEHQFVRPAHWMVLLFGNAVMEAEILGLSADRISYGHRFHAPEPINLDSASDYVQRLENDGHVIADFEARRQSVQTQIQKKITEIGGLAHYNDALLNEITALVEWPVAVVGHFEREFLKLPAEVLITTMQTNQKYVPVQDNQGQLLANFITFMNIDSSNHDVVRQGNERVIRPRLGDAAFFWKQDTKKPLAARVNDLGQVIEHIKLGSLLDKTKRLESICEFLSRQLKVYPEFAIRAAHLSKTDLLTDMVGEFASLQGVMGRYYALHDNEQVSVANALQEQYMPRQSGGDLPQSTTGQILSLADKLDTLVGFFSIGITPSGVKDPYGLRRAALGILRILIENNLDLDLSEMVQLALQQHTHDNIAEDTEQIVVQFLLERLRGYCIDQGYLADEFEAVKTVNSTRPVDFIRRLEAVKDFRQLPESESLAAANKRIRNLLRKLDETLDDTVNTELLADSHEQSLHVAMQQARQSTSPLLKQFDYSKALQQLASLKEPVDGFFDHVMVMTDDSDLKNNRLALLQSVQQLFLQIADIGKLQGTG